MAVALRHQNAVVPWLASNFQLIILQASDVVPCAACQILKPERWRIAKARQPKTNWTPTRRLVGAWLATSASKVVPMISLQCVISRVNAAVCGRKLAQQLAAATMDVLNMTLSAAAVWWMRQSQLATRQVWFVVGRHWVLPTCHPSKKKELPNQDERKHCVVASCHQRMSRPPNSDFATADKEVAE